MKDVIASQGHPGLYFINERDSDVTQSEQQTGFSVRYWGVRGSIATPGPGTLRYGGNTSCVEICCGDHRFVIDSGTGIRGLGDVLTATGEPVECHLLYSHLHWDHIQGLPFFMPAYSSSTTVHLYGARRPNTDLESALRKLMTFPHSPVEWEALAANFIIQEFEAGETLQIGDVRIHTCQLNHPGQSTAYRFEYAGRSFVHATDHEHGEAAIDAGLTAFTADADYLSYDASYTEEEYAGSCGQAHIGWGHSTWEEAVALSKRARVGNLVLFHHAPTHDDAQMDDIHAQAKALFPATLVAREGMVIELL